jgi:hypothetical protein
MKLPELSKSKKSSNMKLMKRNNMLMNKRRLSKEKLRNSMHILKKLKKSTLRTRLN